MKGETSKMKHKFKKTYETDGLPICPDAIHKQLDQAMIKILKQLVKINPYYYDSIYEYLKDVHQSTKKQLIKPQANQQKG